jgi:hypothetical protein
LYRADSRIFLRWLLANPAIPKEHVLFYLDAHWGDDLPLMEELTIIAPNWSESAIVIDDFQVPGDSGYGFDDYGQQGRLTVDFLPELAGWGALYPSAASAIETGGRRGYVVLYPLGAFDLDAMLACGLRPA